MTQDIIVALIVAAAGLWLGVQGVRYFRPRRGGKMCGGGCCDGGEQKKTSAPATPAGERVMMISSDDLRARIKVRQQEQHS